MSEAMDQLEAGTKTDFSPLSPVQRSRLAWCPAHAAEAVMGVRVRLDGALDVHRLAGAIDAVAARYELLAMAIVRRPELTGPVQGTHDAPAVLEITRHEEQPSRASELAEGAAASANAEGTSTGECGPRLRLCVAAHGDGRAELIIELPWLLSDRATLASLVAEIARAYAGERGSSAGDVLQFLDVADWQEDLLESDAAQDARRFWQARTTPSRQGPERTFGVRGADASAARALTVRRTLAPPLVESLARWSSAHAVSVATLLGAAFSALLYRRAGTAVSLAVQFDGREAPELADVLGPLDRWVPLAAEGPEPPGATGFSTYAKRWAELEAEHKRWLDAFDGSAGEEGATLGPFDAAFSASGSVAAKAASNGVAFRIVEWDRGPLPAPVLLEATLGEGSARLTWVACAGTYDMQALEAIAAQFEVLLTSALVEESTLDALRLVPVADASPSHVSLASAPSPTNTALIPDRFAATLTDNPDAPCVVDEFAMRSRADLDRMASHVATTLRDEGLGSEARIGICLPRSALVVAATLGVWRVGGTAVPLEPELPQLALATRVREGRLAALLVAKGTAFDDTTFDDGVRRVELDTEALTTGTLTSATADATSAPVTREQLAYGIFTSGSSGLPKLVGIDHGALASYVGAIEDRLRLESDKAYATVSSFASDLGHTAIFPSLATGGTLHVIGSERIMDPDRLAERLRTAPVDVMKIVPSHLAALLCGKDPADVLPREILVCGGERLPAALVRRVRELAPSLRLVNHYGPTEATVGVLTHEIEAIPIDQAPPLGGPLPGNRVEVRDVAGQLVPRGIPGELWIGGRQLAHGYLESAAQTAERFSGRAGERRYRTGDRVRMDADGLVHFLGRMDEQVKIRGLRVEPAEVEQCLATHPQVSAAAVCLVEDQLVAYVTGEVDPSALAPWLTERLPAGLVPERVLGLTSFPLTPNGKVDKAALPAPPPLAEEIPYVAPEGETEAKLATIFGEVLDQEHVSAGASFFQIGGHSLLATRAVSRIRAEFQVDLPLTALFEAPTVRGLASRVLGAPSARTSTTADAPLAIVDREAPIPLSFSQRRMWLLDRLEPQGRAAYAIPMAVRIRGPFDATALATSVAAIVARHESLRTVFVTGEDGEPRQRVLAAEVAPEVGVETIDLADVAPEDRERTIGQALAMRTAAPFDLERGPLLRVALAQLTAQDHVLVAVCHHVVFDAWSRAILLKELATTYMANVRGLPDPLAPLTVQYPDYATWQRDWLAGAQLEEQLAYWRDTLAGAPSLLPLPADRPRLRRPTHRGHQLRFAVDAATGTALAALAEEEGATLFMVLLAAFDVLLYRLTGETDVVVGSPIANRRRAEFEQLIGFFSNTIVLRTSLHGVDSFRALVQRVRQVALDAYAHQDLPFEELVEALPVTRDLSANPVFQVLFTLRNTPPSPRTVEGLTFEPVDAPAAAAKFDLTVQLEEAADGGLVGSFEYATDLFDEQTVVEWQAGFTHLLRALARDPSQRVRGAPLGLPVSVCAPASTPTQRPSTVDAWFRDVLPRHAQSPAVGIGGEFLTYAELDRRAALLAGILRARGVRPEERIGIAAERGPAEWVAMLAIWRTGGAYVPLDPDFPRERLTYMVANSRIRLVVTSGARASDLVENVETLALDDPALWTQASPATDQAPTPGRLAYVLYTSGSTGVPKGVCVSHGSACFFLEAMTQRLEWSADVRMLAVTTLGFDIALLERWGPLLVGGCSEVVSADEAADGIALAKRLASSAPNAMQATPATWRLLRDAAWPGAMELTALIGGEALPVELADWVRARSAAVWNLYGPTETTVWSAAHRHDEGDATGLVSLGTPLGATHVAVLDAGGRPVPTGVWGELAIGGPGVARGYEARAAETARRFVPDPFARTPGERLYLTGDVCRLRRDGTLAFGGRRDGQVKLRGLRIEIGELEAALADVPHVTAGAAILHEEQLTLFVEPASATGAGEHGGAERAVAVARGIVENVRSTLRQRLPAYMVPQHIETIPALPLTPNNKIDRRALTALARGQRGASRAYVAPRSETEATVCEIFAEVLGLERVSVEDSFFDLGGHSLLATRVAVRMRDRLGVEIPLRELFDAPTPAALAVRVGEGGLASAGGGSRVARAPLRALPRPAEVPLSYAQERLWFVDQMNPGDASYAIPMVLRLSGPLDSDALGACLRAVVARHEVLRTTFASVAGRPVQIIHPADSSLAEQAAAVQTADLTTIEAGERDQRLREWVGKVAREPFDLDEGPLLRTQLLRLGERDHVVILVMHHIASDGWSAGVLARELTALYAGRVAGLDEVLPPLEVQYADWAIHERTVLDEAAVEEELTYWRQRLAGMPSRVLAPDVEQASTPAECSFTVDARVADALDRLAAQEQASLFMVCLAAFSLLLGREGDSDDIVVGTDVAHRTHTAAEKLIGFFVNVLPLRTDLAGRPTFAELVGRVCEVCLEAYAHEDVPFARLASAVSDRRQDGRTPLIQVLFVLQNLPAVQLQLAELEAQVLELAAPTTKFDLAFFFRRSDAGLSGTWRYDAGKFSSARIERLGQRFEQLLSTVAAAPQTVIDDLDLRTEQEQMVDQQRTQRRAASRKARLKRASARPVAQVASSPVVPGATIEGLTRGEGAVAQTSAPWCVHAQGDDADLVAWVRAERSAVEDALTRHGAVLLRGGPFHEETAFEALGRALLTELYGEYGDLPRSQVSRRVYGSTPYPADRAIRFHSESSHLTTWPTRILFGCVVPSQTRGETPLADGRVVLDALPAEVRARFVARGLRYSRTFTAGLDVRWQDFFRAESRDEVEAACAHTGTECQWDADGTLHIADVRPAVSDHPDHGGPVWFNQVALHHPHYLDAGVKEALLAKYGVERLPRNVTYGDGSPISEADLAAMDQAYERARVEFPWQRGDVLLLDNERVAHGRNPFTGERRIIVAMGRMRGPDGQVIAPETSP
ncbi:MAG: amino acid adenylation domain-containing protein [Pseudomonadota bacterium]